MNVIAIIQARVGSTRFPRKIFADLSGKPLIWHVFNRIKYCKNIDNFLLATSLNPIDNELEEWSINNKIKCFRGSENDVLERFYFASKKHKADVIVRITADDPFKDPVIIDNVISLMINNKCDFAYNNNPPSFPEGLDTEVISFNSLEKAYYESKDVFDREHLTQYLYKHPELFRQINYSYSENLSHLRWTVDTKEDYDFAKIIYQNLFKHNKVFLMNDILNYIKRHPEVLNINIKVERSSMYRNL